MIHHLRALVSGSASSAFMAFWELAPAGPVVLKIAFPSKSSYLIFWGNWNDCLLTFSFVHTPLIKSRKNVYLGRAVIIIRHCFSGSGTFLHSGFLFSRIFVVKGCVDSCLFCSDFSSACYATASSQLGRRAWRALRKNSDNASRRFRYLKS